MIQGDCNTGKVIDTPQGMLPDRHIHKGLVKINFMSKYLAWI